MRFDAYAATIEAEPADVAGNIAARFPASWAELCTPRYGYHHAQKLSYAGDTALLMHRTHGQVPECHVAVQGLWSPDLAAGIRLDHPDHSVARADSCLDLQQPDLWDWLVPIAIDLATANGCRIDQAGDWITPAGIANGRTLYIGSPSSATRIRIYEKGKQLRTLRLDPDAPLDWLRVEVQARPQKDAKRRFASATPEEVFAASKVATQLLSIITGRQVDHLPAGHVRRPGTDAGIRFRNLARQYGAFLLELLDSGLSTDDLATLLRKQHDAPNAPDILQARHAPHAADASRAAV